MSINWWVDKQNVIFPLNGLLFGNKKECNINACYNMDEPQKHCSKWKKLVTEDHVLHDSVYMNSLE